MEHNITTAPGRGRGRRAFLRGAGGAISAALVARPAAASRLEPAADDAALIRGLYRDWAASVSAERPRDGLIGLMHDPAAPPETIEFGTDAATAVARFHCRAQLSTALVGDASLIEMARLQGQHAETWWESGIHELDCEKTPEGWKIRRVAYQRIGPPA